jgi:hypothetical protein
VRRSGSLPISPDGGAHLSCVALVIQRLGGSALVAWVAPILYHSRRVGPRMLPGTSAVSAVRFAGLSALSLRRLFVAIGGGAHRRAVVGRPEGGLLLRQGRTPLLLGDAREVVNEGFAGDELLRQAQREEVLLLGNVGQVEAPDVLHPGDVGGEEALGRAPVTVARAVEAGEAVAESFEVVWVERIRHERAPDRTRSFTRAVAGATRELQSVSSIPVGSVNCKCLYTEPC